MHRHNCASPGVSLLVVISAFASLSVLARRFCLDLCSTCCFLPHCVSLLIGRCKNKCTHHSLFLSLPLVVFILHSEGRFQGRQQGMNAIPVCSRWRAICLTFKQCILNAMRPVRYSEPLFAIFIISAIRLSSCLRTLP